MVEGPRHSARHGPLAANETGWRRLSSRLIPLMRFTIAARSGRENNIAFLLERRGIVRQADAHEVARERLGQMFTVRRAQSQARAQGLREILQEQSRQRVEPMEVND